ncbi:MAG: hypothetical protein HUU29_14380 [Planctomycetaceae bacterium]|nr:hypothetical protein [Planctomycetaceae bacterium]
MLDYSLYNYTWNRVCRASDPFGLYSFDVDDENCTVTLNFKLQFFFDDGVDANGNPLKWTEAEKTAYAETAESLIESTWGGGWKIVPGKQNYQSGSTIEWIYGDWFGVGVECLGPVVVPAYTACPCQSGYVTKVNITSVIGGSNPTDDVEAKVVKIPQGDWKRSYAGTSTASLDSEDVRERTMDNGMVQVPIVHEFGHMIGLHHPCHNKPNNPNCVDSSGAVDEYLDPNTGKPSSSVMGSGMSTSADLMEQWREAVNDEHSECGPFSIERVK